MQIHKVSKQELTYAIACRHISIEVFEKFVYLMCGISLLPVDREKERKIAKTIPEYVSLDELTDDFVRNYDELVNYPEMSEDAIKEFLKNYHDNEKYDKSSFINSHAYLVFSIAKEYIGMDVSLSFADLLMTALDGLTYSIQHFDCNSNIRFIDYASWVIHFIINYHALCIIHDYPLMSVENIFYLEQYTALFSAQHELRILYEREPTKEELLKYLDMDDNQVFREPTEQELDEIRSRIPYVYRKH